ncbi:MAG: hypothetical protein K8H88_00660, partial [Sandaracinaceae bacterium]|nr:hypothetical protein [Sandaracinaceae bacterium]
MSQQNERAGCDHPDEGPISTADRSSSAVSGDAVVLANNCGLSCTYCGYPDAAVRPVDVPALIDEASLLAKRSASPRRIVGKDPAEHPQFEAVLQSMLRYRSEVSVQSTGLALHRERERWAATQGVRWELPLCSARAEVHDRIVGRPGHHAIVTELLEDPRLAIVVNVLAVRDVLADGNLRELTEYLRKIGRAFVVRLMTPRDSEDVTYYESGIVEPSVLWQALGEALTPQELAGVVLDNVECLPLCTLPEAQQGLYARAFATDMGLDSPRAQTPSLAGLE